MSPKPDPVPKSIQNNVSFAIFYPQPSQQTVFKQNSFKYDKTLAQVTFVINFDKQKITFAEQSTPDSFVNDPNLYSQFVKSLNGYTSFDSLNGRVDLVRPTELRTETGVMNAKGTLMFAESDGNLNEDNWRLVFNSLLNTQPN